MDAYLRICKLLFPVQEPLYTRDRPLEVLCLGLSRSGTESLCKALQQIGYDDVYHGLQLIDSRVGEIPQWRRLAHAKHDNDETFLCAAEFDKVLGHCNAVTDTPCCCFGPELIRSYPRAKIVLNRRTDVAAWEQSIRSTLVGRFDSWWSRVPLWFETSLFWTGMLNLRVFEPLMLQPLRNFPGGMAKGYETHYEDIEVLCKALDREYLIWSVEDGWEPLCRYLGKDVPDAPFPSGNTPADMADFARRVHMPRVARGKRNMTIWATAAVGVVSAALWRLYSR